VLRELDGSRIGAEESHVAERSPMAQGRTRERGHPGCSVQSNMSPLLKCSTKKLRVGVVRQASKSKTGLH